MEHRTTIVELVIEPADLFAITENCALNSQFSIYEKDEKRTIYCKKFRFMRAWLSVQYEGEKGKVEAWLSVPGVGPDFVGNAWVGWKSAVPQGFSFGPKSICKKDFEKLLSLLSSKSTNMVRFEAGRQGNRLQPTLNKSTISKGLAIFGVISFLAGIVSVLSAVSLILQSSFPSLTNTMLISGVSDMILGALSFASSRALSKGKVLGIWLYGISYLLGIINSIVMGYKLNYIFMALGLLFIWRMVELKSEWNLT